MGLGVPLSFFLVNLNNEILQILLTIKVTLFENPSYFEKKLLISNLDHLSEALRVFPILAVHTVVNLILKPSKNLLNSIRLLEVLFHLLEDIESNP